MLILIIIKIKNKNKKENGFKDQYTYTQRAKIKRWNLQTLTLQIHSIEDLLGKI